MVTYIKCLDSYINNYYPFNVWSMNPNRTSGEVAILIYVYCSTCHSSVCHLYLQSLVNGVFPLLLILVSCKKTEICIARRRRKDVAVLTMETRNLWRSLYSYYIVPLSLPFACFCPRKSKAHCDGCRKCKGCVAWPNQAYQGLQEWPWLNLIPIYGAHMRCVLFGTLRFH
jgi:hypothetical protein